MPGQVILKKRQKPRFSCAELVVTCLGGAESVLVRELHSSPVRDVRPESGAVRCAADGCHAIPQLNRSLRSASRVLASLVRAPANTFDEVYGVVRDYPWHRLLPVDASFMISASSRSRSMPDHRFLAMRVKDAIVDAQRDAFAGKRSSVNKTHPDLIVTVHLDDSGIEVSLDSSGAPLHERGYRTEAGEAPLRETLAATILLRAGWKPDTVLLDPFCGSGTIAIEAAMIARGLAPGTWRSSWAWQRWPWKDDSYVIPPGRQTTGARQGTPRIVASDIDPRMVAMAQRNAERAGVLQDIHFAVADAGEALRNARGDRGLVVANPPYGQRMQDPKLAETYRRFAEALRGKGAGWNAWLLLGEDAPARAMGLAPDRKISLFNGGTRVQLCHYSIRPRGRGR